MGLLPIIIKREFLAKVRNKSFIVMTFISPLIFVGIGVLIGYLTNVKPDLKTIAIKDQSGLFIHQFKSDDEYRFVDVNNVDLKILTDSVISTHYNGILNIPPTVENGGSGDKITYISNDSPSMTFIGSLERAISKKMTSDNFIAAKLDTVAIKNAQAKVNIKLAKASGESSLKGLNEIKIAIGGAFGYLIMMFIIIYGNMVMRSVIEEKTSRIIEIIISSVKPFQLMMGKIIGTSLAGILQFCIWAIIGLLLLFGASMFFGVNMAPSSSVSPEVIAAAQDELGGTIQLYLQEIWNLPIAAMISAFFLYFIGGYFLYSSFYAAIGAAVDNETDSQQFLFPIIMPLILGVYIGIFTVINDPHGTIATVFSMIPLTSPIVMLMRIPFGVPWWQVVLSLSILFGSFMIVVWFASKIYRVGILMYGKKPTWKELIKWMRYSG